jgi:hypothetical protein
MPRISDRAAKNRLAVVVGVTAMIAASWLLLRGPGVELLSEETVSGKVVEVIHGKSGTTPESAAVKGMGIVVIELPDGGHARVFAPLSKASIGSEIRLKVKRYSDGRRHVTGGDEGT